MKSIYVSFIGDYCDIDKVSQKNFINLFIGKQKINFDYRRY